MYSVHVQNHTLYIISSNLSDAIANNNITWRLFTKRPDTGIAYKRCITHANNHPRTFYLLLQSSISKHWLIRYLWVKSLESNALRSIWLEYVVLFDLKTAPKHLSTITQISRLYSEVPEHVGFWCKQVQHARMGRTWFNRVSYI